MGEPGMKWAQRRGKGAHGDPPFGSVSRQDQDLPALGTTGGLILLPGPTAVLPEGDSEQGLAVRTCASLHAPARLREPTSVRAGHAPGAQAGPSPRSPKASPTLAQAPDSPEQGERVKKRERKEA